LRKEKLERRFTEDDNDEIGGRSGRVDEQRAFGKPQFLLVFFKACTEERFCFLPNGKTLCSKVLDNLYPPGNVPRLLTGVLRFLTSGKMVYPQVLYIYVHRVMFLGFLPGVSAESTPFFTQWEESFVHRYRTIMSTG
jgi:hypothetical protein